MFIPLHICNIFVGSPIYPSRLVDQRPPGWPKDDDVWFLLGADWNIGEMYGIMMDNDGQYIYMINIWILSKEV